MSRFSRVFPCTAPRHRCSHPSWAALQMPLRNAGGRERSRRARRCLAGEKSPSAPQLPVAPLDQALESVEQNMSVRPSLEGAAGDGKQVRCGDMRLPLCPILVAPETGGTPPGRGQESNNHPGEDQSRKVSHIPQGPCESFPFQNDLAPQSPHPTLGLATPHNGQ